MATMPGLMITGGEWSAEDRTGVCVVLQALPCRCRSSVITVEERVASKAAQGSQMVKIAFWVILSDLPWPQTTSLPVSHGNAQKCQEGRTPLECAA